ncbi:MAG: SDR family oxidoreductase [Alphaproteobacteria bacterium]
MADTDFHVVLVTGCSTGIGRALAREMRARGMRVFASARRPESIADLAGEGIECLRLDVNDPGSIREAVATVLERAGRIDAVVNNAGMNLIGPLAELPLDNLRAILETNVVGLVAVTQAVVPSMAARGRGRIVNVGSVVGILPTPYAGAYCASKSAVHILSDVLRMEVAPFGIDVVVVQPGGVRSAISETGSGDIERYREEGSLYRAGWDGIHKRAWASQQGAMPAEDFAREMVTQAFADPAPRIVRLGTGSDSLPRVAELPGEERDAMMSASFGLDALRRPQG